MNGAPAASVRGVGGRKPKEVWLRIMCIQCIVDYHVYTGGSCLVVVTSKMDVVGLILQIASRLAVESRKWK
jgi:hypothetical protein